MTQATCVIYSAKLAQCLLDFLMILCARCENRNFADSLVIPPSSALASASQLEHPPVLAHLHKCPALIALARDCKPPWKPRRQLFACHSGLGGQDSSSLGTAARRLTLSRYVARLKPRCGSLALSVMWYVLTVSRVGAVARVE